MAPGGFDRWPSNTEGECFLTASKTHVIEWTEQDMEIYRRCHILERLLCALASSSMPNTCNEKIINLLYHCSFVGGSSTLITRYGLLSWVNIMVKAGHPAVSDVQNLKRLAIQVYETSEKGRIDDWSGAAVMSLFNTLSKDHVVV